MKFFEKHLLPLLYLSVILLICFALSVLLQGKAIAFGNYGVLEIRNKIPPLTQSEVLNGLRLKYDDGGKNLARAIGILHFSRPCDANEQKPYEVHIITPIKRGTSEMYRYDLKGYAYGNTTFIDGTWVGYTFGGKPDSIAWTDTRFHGPAGSTASLDFAGEFVRLKFGPVNGYCLSFSLDYMSGATGEKVRHDASGYSVTFEPI